MPELSNLMPELPNLMKNRLVKASQGIGAHPDADQLTAYAERLLASDERGLVLEHLALCSQCRDVVFLTLEPVADEKVVAVVPMRRRRWFLTPQFGLAAAVAALAVGIGVNTVVRLKTSPPTQNLKSAEEAKAVPPATISSDSPQNADKDSQATAGSATKTATQPETAGTLAQAGAVDARNAPLQDAKSVAAVPGKSGGPQGNTSETRKKDSGAGARSELASAAPARRDYVNLQLFSSDASYQGVTGGELPSAPSPAPATSVTQAKVATQISPSVFADIPSNAGKQSQRGMVLYQPPSAHQSVGISAKIADLGKHLHMKRLGPAIPAEAIKSFAMASAAPPVDQSSEVLAAKPAEKARGGALSESSAFSVNGLRGRNSDQETDGPKWKVDHGKLVKISDSNGPSEIAGTSGIEFSVVTVNGADVWAGGSRAALIHSADGGATWDRIAPGESASGTVVSIETSGASVTVKTSSNQTWTSQDGGKSWILQ